MALEIFDKDTQKTYKKIVISELKKFNIRYKFKGGVTGSAYKNHIIIPRPVNIICLGHCFHEIGHLVKNHFGVRKYKKPDYYHEYEAEQYALMMLKKYIDNYNQIEIYEVKAIWYVLTFLEKEKKNNDIKFEDIPKDIRKWCNIKKGLWNNSKSVEIQLMYQYEKKEHVKIKYI